MDSESSVTRALHDGSEDRLIREEPLLLRVHEEPLLTMRTPGNDADLALGFLLSEGILLTPDELLASRFEPGDTTTLRPDTLHLELARGAVPRVKRRLARTHEIRASCGVCGLGDPAHLLEDLPPLLTGTPRFELALVEQLRKQAEALQPAFRATGASHGAALFAADGALLGSGEDVGRHNALDKAIGAAARQRHELSHAIAFLSGRAGFDLVLKCLRVRVPVILSASAPSALGFDLCAAAGATLIGFVREGRSKVYCDGQRLL